MKLYVLGEKKSFRFFLFFNFSSEFFLSSFLFSLPTFLKTPKTKPTPHRDEERAVVGVERHVAEGKQREDDDLEEEGRDEASVF